MENALEFLLDQAKEKESQAVLALNKARAELDDYYKQVEQIEKYRLDYCNQLVERGKGGLTASQYGHLNRFLTQLDETLAKQKAAEEHFVTQVTNCEEHWLDQRKNRRSYEWMIEKKANDKRIQQEKIEQRQMDEFSTLQFARNKRSF
ncbi:flagellar biosynthesis chaperone [Vibrio nigripulchritudo ATCC 27043]|uniref:Flagellar FliJ protein n=2 Tax=Vibrio nigripulchritudo TaxID=28173 RepID=U4K9R2_9VIBR|nr:flagellar export protein FliJ [Vibrio nigripulchritudo]EGU54298.1 flagellar biosynthesis chaperone [Vibrio nigripulchritudo ATCC 27043]KJY80225.1 flagellar biogenesis protein [Vibrio nigripulchritudo]CCN36027.1 putative Flagellar protein fliJ [Vibrio nigripulchritudo AM115]CCN44308.1 putative Flagellar protein fliJ [Vibrio nigripulchritudo FTn2]CCN68044.1 putative Flagellar protein fliJ [Vibrio nigripulchritudo POn4]